MYHSRISPEPKGKLQPSVRGAKIPFLCREQPHLEVKYGTALLDKSLLQFHSIPHLPVLQLKYRGLEKLLYDPANAHAIKIPFSLKFPMGIWFRHPLCVGQGFTAVIKPLTALTKAICSRLLSKKYHSPRFG